MPDRHPPSEDVTSSAWIAAHGISFSRQAGLYESETAWITVNEEGTITSAGLKTPILGPYGVAHASDPEPDEESSGEGCVAVFEKVQRAVRTMRLLPSVAVRSRFCNWPDIIQNFFDAYGYTPGRVRITPTARQLSEMDEVIGWLSWVSRALTPDHMRIVWARAEGRSWRQIGYIVGLSHTASRERFRIAVAEIYEKFINTVYKHSKT